MTASLSPDMFDAACPTTVMPFQIGDKWTAMVVLCLEGGPRRFTELRVPLRTVTPKVLSATLRSMERDGLITRFAYDENPPRVEYALTPLGRSLLTLVAAARTWCTDHLDDLLEARAAFAARD
ncbi:transcriptional regulator [Actinoplanes ianthinogenes]|uniref:Transcriptional regulator n=1 Tax=Actinoplanes ianthinogenes TaxID=122358 RepID=A0ABM7LKL6_9ACTN|nr:helix-turn-helix domain-containing protein [Actinoplanes ianthinogenes]BCJ39792.1 transcriptional regulator [Actinoplanes ianthinogenes]GGR59896.1 transcriptional regulator [Actinoplanes ianthinogenes]